MQYTSETVGLLQLDDYVAEIAGIYKNNDTNRSIWDVWCHALHHAAAIAERLRKVRGGRHADRVLDEIADFSLWLFTFVRKASSASAGNEFTNPISSDALIRIQTRCANLVWQRYPRICPFCYVRRSKEGIGSSQELRKPCDCASAKDVADQSRQKRRESAEALRMFSQRHDAEMPRSVDEWQDMFATVFRTNLSETSSEQAVFRLLEELGEMSDAMARMYSFKQSDFVQGEPRQRRLRLESQIADIFSWLFSLVDTLSRASWLGNAAESVPTRLSEIIWRRYGSDDLRSFYCRHCGNRECDCRLIFVPATRSLREFRSIDG